tara:strand:- start:185 stop:670 length:486 start_codon:yes stop_codon:yes gene_type:complete
LTKKFIVGKLGKPHGLKGYAYIHLNEYLKRYDFKDIEIEINKESFSIEELKNHLRDRHLIKLYKINSIEQIKEKRDSYIYLDFNSIIKMKQDLPWPEIFLGERIKNIDNLEIFLSRYKVYNSNTVLELTSNSSESYMVPYVTQNFKFDGKHLYLNENLAIY